MEPKLITLRKEDEMEEKTPRRGVVDVMGLFLSDADSISPIDYVIESLMNQYTEIVTLKMPFVRIIDHIWLHNNMKSV